jgi:hypothetical protein
MAIDERARHDLHRRAAQVLGDPPADTLMSLLPPVGWADVVTKDHLDQRLALLSSDLRAEMADGDASLKLAMERGFRRQNAFIAGLMVGQWGVTVAIVQLLTG